MKLLQLSWMFIYTGMEHCLSQLVELCAAYRCLSHMDGAQETPAVSSVFTGCSGLCHLSHNSAVCVWIQLE